MLTANKLILQYNLHKHPEGGWYKETYRSTDIIAQHALPDGFNGSRSLSTAIYFLLEKGNFSAFHKIKSDECWHFYAGESLLIYVLKPNGTLDIISLGNKVEQGDQFQYVVPANCWFASRPAATSAFCFVGCTVSPGFDFDDFEMANSNALTALFPSHAIIINDLCR